MRDREGEGADRWTPGVRTGEAQTGGVEEDYSDQNGGTGRRVNGGAEEQPRGSHGGTGGLWATSGRGRGGGQ